MVSDLDRDAYKTINTCHSFVSGFNYYIGLVGGLSRCMNSVSPFESVKSRNCADGSPLGNIIIKDNQKCVVIAKQYNNFQRVQIYDCSTAERYICQTRNGSSATPTLQSTKIPKNKPPEMISDETASSSITAVNDDINSIMMLFT